MQTRDVDHQKKKIQPSWIKPAFTDEYLFFFFLLTVPLEWLLNIFSAHPIFGVSKLVNTFAVGPLIFQSLKTQLHSSCTVYIKDAKAPLIS